MFQLQLVLPGPIDPRTKLTTTLPPALINTRATGERQGASPVFTTMNSHILGQISNGQVYNTVYPASWDQQSEPGTQDIIKKIQSTLAMRPNECFILQGYSQGATATVAALSRLNGSAASAVKGVFLIGNPVHRAGLACNVDVFNGSTTLNVDGLLARYPPIPAAWVGKTLDVCKYGDGVCDTTHGYGINSVHLSYAQDANVQALGQKWILARLEM